MTSRKRLVGAVFAGLIAIFVITTATDVVMHATRVYPPWGQPMSDGLFGFATLYRVIYGIAGGYITARVAREQAMQAAVTLGVVGIVISAAGAAATWNRPDLGPNWYPLLLVVTALPCAWLGGKLRVAQQRRPALA